jgi:hypothetical protein
MHVHTPQDGQLERGNELLVGQEIRRGDPDRTPRQIDRGQQDQNQLIDLLVRPRRRSCAPPIRGSPAPDAPSLSHRLFVGRK